MIMSYDSILGVPLVETGPASSQYNKFSNGLGLGGPFILLLVVIVLLFVLFIFQFRKK